MSEVLRSVVDRPGAPWRTPSAPDEVVLIGRSPDSVPGLVAGGER